MKTENLGPIFFNFSTHEYLKPSGKIRKIGKLCFHRYTVIKIIQNVHVFVNIMHNTFVPVCIFLRMVPLKNSRKENLNIMSILIMIRLK